MRFLDVRFEVEDGDVVATSAQLAMYGYGKTPEDALRALFTNASEFFPDNDRPLGPRLVRIKRRIETVREWGWL